MDPTDFVVLEADAAIGDSDRPSRFRVRAVSEEEDISSGDCASGRESEFSTGLDVRKADFRCSIQPLPRIRVAFSSSLGAAFVLYRAAELGFSAAPLDLELETR